MRYLGIPYRDHGRDLDGIDCWGLVLLFYADHGVQLDALPGVWRHDPELADRITREAVNWTRVESPRYGDVVVFRIAGRPRHVGVMLDQDRFVHAQHGTGSCIERLSNLRWAPRVEGVYRSGRTLGHEPNHRPTPPAADRNGPG